MNGNVDMNRFYTDFNGIAEKVEREDKCNLNLQGFQAAANADGYRDADGNPLEEDGLDGERAQYVRRQIALKAKLSGGRYLVGSSGYVVGWWQRRCNEILGHSQAVDKLYGQRSWSETMLLQEKLGLKADGIAGYNSIQSAFYN